MRQEGYPDFTSWDPNDKRYDPKSTQANPRWFMVDVRLEFVFNELIGLPDLRQCASLKDMVLLRKGSRLSVQPVRKKEFDAILKMAGK
ncbi:MAG: EVE domain-containing protein [Pirellulaceae bacterium]|nr:EVE domain-containing protein [Pirellulaceae bacterium]HJN09262.1 EVE domain-containing protein [Pirellulaceae bacterium]